jgi:Transcriptional regulatory protein, C terminal
MTTNTLPGTTVPTARQHLRAVGPDDAFPPLPGPLPPGATWVPVPAHHVPAAPGRPPMVGYIVLVPADQVPDGALPPGGALDAAALEAALLSAASEAAAPVPERGIHIDAERRTTHVEGEPIDLTYLEFELLAHLVAHPHRVHSRDQLVTSVWGYGHVGDGRTVDVHVARLRRKLGPAHRGTIVTVRRVGYTYAPAP